MVFGCFIGDTYCKAFVVHEYRADKVDGAVGFTAINLKEAGRFLFKKFSSLPAMSYNKFCTVPNGSNCTFL